MQRQSSSYVTPPPRSFLSFPQTPVYADFSLTFCNPLRPSGLESDEMLTKDRD